MKFGHSENWDSDDFDLKHKNLPELCGDEVPAVVFSRVKKYVLHFAIVLSHPDHKTHPPSRQLVAAPVFAGLQKGLQEGKLVICGFPARHGGTPNGCLIRELTSMYKWMIWGVPLFQETSACLSPSYELLTIC